MKADWRSPKELKQGLPDLIEERTVGKIEKIGELPKIDNSVSSNSIQTIFDLNAI